MGEHTPTPWCIPFGEQNGFIICAGHDRNKPGPILMVLRTPLGRDSFLTDADINDNAAFIVKAVNAHCDLVKALEDLQSAETVYRMCHDLDGDGNITAGRAWDKMKQAGNRARSLLADISRASTPDLHGEGG